MHGGAKGSGAPKGKRNGMWRHGGDTQEAIALRKAISHLLKTLRVEVRPGAPASEIHFALGNGSDT